MLPTPEEFDYKAILDDVRQKLESYLADELIKFYQAQNKMKMRSLYHRRAQGRAAAPDISKGYMELLAAEAIKHAAEEESKAGMPSGPSGPKGKKPGKPTSSAKSALEEALEEIVGGSEGKPEADDDGGDGSVDPFNEAETTDELLDIKGKTRVMKEGREPSGAVKTAIDKMETTANRICACPRCVKRGDR